MTFRISIQKRAESQISEAYSWYEQKQTHLGAEFLMAIEEQLTQIEANPYLFQIKYKNLYLAKTRKFPYGLFYFIDHDKIIVLAVFHLSRNPGLWKKLKKEG